MDTIAPIRPPIEQLPPGLHKALSTLLFSSPSWPLSKGEAMLTCLLRYATVQQFTLNEEGSYATIAIPNLLKIYRADRRWQQVCCYQTLHTFMRLLCVLNILKKQRIPGQPTSYLLPIDPQYRFEATPSILAALDRLCDPQGTKNPKMRKKARDVKYRLLCLNPTLSQSSRAHEDRRDVPHPSAFQQRIRRLVDSLGLSVSVASLLLQGVSEICAEVVGQTRESTVFVDSAGAGLSQVIAAGDSIRSRTTNATTPRISCNKSTREHVQGDSSCLLSAKESPEVADLGDSSPAMQDKESPSPSLLVDSFAASLAAESPSESTPGDSLQARSEHKDPLFEHTGGKESLTHAKNLRDALPSSIDSLQKKDSLETDLELECPQSWTGSEEDLYQEALRYLRLFDGSSYATADYVQTHAGKKALGGYRNKIRRNPWLARVSAINTLLQRTFYDLSRQKKPLENPGKWFHASFDRYADSERPMEITGEILDWAKSPYTLEEIARVLPLERKRQETQWQTPERLHRPFASCVHVHHHDGQSSLVVQSREDEIGTLGPRPAQGMDHVEAEQLAQEIHEQAFWYLEQAHARREPTLGELVYVVEATAVGFTLSNVYTCRDDWWQEHQTQMQHRAWELQFEEGVRCATYSA